MRRMRRLEGTAFAARGNAAAAERLARQALEGHAWQADHILPVYKGGGLCDLENMRTLCVPCHQVGAPQAALIVGGRPLFGKWTFD